MKRVAFTLFLLAGFARGETIHTEVVNECAGNGVDYMFPRGTAPFPALVYIHGGGFRHGSRVDFRKYLYEGTRLGYVAFSLDYRLSQPGDPSYPEAYRDVRCLVRWIRANAGRLQVDPGRIGAVGASAGATLSQVLGYVPRSAGFDVGPYLNMRSRVQAVGSFYGATDAAAQYRDTDALGREYSRLFFGGTPEQYPDRYVRGSPLTYVLLGERSRLAPTFLYHGARDRLVPRNQGDVLFQVLNQKGVPARQRIDQNARHEGITNDWVRAEMYPFLAGYLSPRPVSIPYAATTDAVFQPGPFCPPGYQPAYGVADCRSGWCNGNQFLCKYRTTLNTQFVSVTLQDAYLTTPWAGCLAGYAERGTFGHWGSQRLCVKYLSANLQPAGTGYVEDLYISPPGFHLFWGPQCPAGYYPRGDTADCGLGFCFGVQRLCAKYAGLPW